MKVLNSLTVRKINLEQIIFFGMVFFVFIFNYQEESYKKLLTNSLIIVFITYEFAIKIRGNNWHLRNSYYSMSFLLFLIVCLVSISYSSSFYDSADKVKTLFILFLLFVSLETFFCDAKMVDFGIITITLCSLISCIYLLTNSDWLTKGSRISGVIGDSNQVGAYMSYSLIVVLLCLKKKLLPRIICISSIIFIFLSNILSGSRSALVVTIIGMFIFLILSEENKKNKILKIVLVFILSIVGVYFLYNLIMTNEILYRVIGIRYASYFDIISTGKSAINENSTFERTFLRQLAWDRFINSPRTIMLGNGIASFNSYYVSVGGESKFCHNDYLELLSGVGIIGTIFFYSPYVVIFIRNFKQNFKIKKAEFALVSAIIIQMLLMHWYVVFYYQKLEFMFLALFAGILSNKNNDTNKKIVHS